jgi:hypothetical protein
MKRTVNRLCGYAGIPPKYAVTQPQHGGDPAMHIKPGQFHNRPLATAAREFLTLRGSAEDGGRGPATDQEIFSALKIGGFVFEARTEETSLRALRISLAKSTQTFYRLPTGEFGLPSWFPGAKSSGDNEPSNKKTATNRKSAAAKAELRKSRAPRKGPRGSVQEPQPTASS